MTRLPGKLGINRAFWRGRRVLVTGHTGFKGSWVCLWLKHLGAHVTGYAMAPPTCPNLFELADIGQGLTSICGDIRDGSRLRSTVERTEPEVIMHMAAQPLVRRSYSDPIETFSTNVMGTVNVLESVRYTPSVRVVIVVTSDKCYRNQGWDWGYRENDALGGHDPYSSSKGCAELVTAAYRQSYFHSTNSTSRCVGIASARAGNVIGGGDWAIDRLIPDMVRAFNVSEPVLIRNPHSVRPWQHVLEPLSGYLLLAERLWDAPQIGESWNFGPRNDDAHPVGWVVERLVELWGQGARWQLDDSKHPREEQMLKLDCSRAANKLGWYPQLSLDTALEWTVQWYRAHLHGSDARQLTLEQIQRYERLIEEVQQTPAVEKYAAASAG